MKKALKIVCLSLVGALTLAGLGVHLFLPVTYKVDKSHIVKNDNYNVKLVNQDGYTSLAKVDINGNYLDDDFKIVGFSDLHLDHYKDRGNYTLDIMIQNIVNEKPDLVVLVGDNITSAINKRRARQLARVMEDLGVYWTLVLGNHEGDNNLTMSRVGQIKFFDKFEHCLVESDTKYTSDKEKVYGNGNHVINLLNSNKKVYQSLYFLDSGVELSSEDETKYKVDVEWSTHYDYIKPSQVKWYEETLLDIQAKNGQVKSMLFDHIAIPEMKQAYTSLIEKETGKAYKDSEYFADVNSLKAPTCETNDSKLLYGMMRERICCPDIDYENDLFDTMEKLGSTKYFICGHDHVNDFAINYKGITLMFNSNSGYSSYNIMGKVKTTDVKLLQGYTTYTVNKAGEVSFNHHINADLYPEIQDEVKKVMKK